MAYIRERNGRFAITLKIGQHLGGKSKTKTFPTKEEVIIWEQEQRLALKRGDPTFNLTKDKFADIATAYLAQVTPMKKSAYNESIIIKRLLTEKWVSIALGELTAGHLCDYRDNRLKSLKPSTFKREWHLVRSIAKYGRAVGVNINLLVFEEPKLPKVYERRIERITPAQEEKLLETARLSGNRVKYMVPFLNLAIATAMRRGEMCSLAWDDVDMEKRRIYIPASKAKSGYSRTIPMTNRAVGALNELLSIRKYDRKTKGLHPNVIPATGNAVRLAYGRIRKLAGLEHIRIHDFRHEAISRFHEAGLTLPEIQSITGHGHIDMLQRYSHASVDNLVAKLGGVK